MGNAYLRKYLWSTCTQIWGGVDGRFREELVWGRRAEAKLPNSGGACGCFGIFHLKFETRESMTRSFLSRKAASDKYPYRGLLGATLQVTEQGEA
jgi:hypothetical protein